MLIKKKYYSQLLNNSHNKFTIENIYFFLYIQYELYFIKEAYESFC